MPTLVRFSGNEEIRGAKFTNPLDRGHYMCMYADSYLKELSPPSKCFCGISRASFKDAGPQRHRNSVSIDILPDECLFEIFRCLASWRDRSVCACVSKRWLMLQCSMHRDEFKRSTTTSLSSTPIAQEKSHAKEKDNELDGNRIEEVFDDGNKSVISHLEQTGNQESESPENCGYGSLSRRLEGKKATDIRLASISIGVNGCGGLGKLYIRGHTCPAVSDTGLTAIGIGCPMLKCLALWDCRLVGDRGLCAIAKGCPLLQNLDLISCPSITDVGLEAVAKKCSSLASLSLESCSGIANNSLIAIGQYCARLQSVAIINCLNISDHGMASLLSRSQELAKLKLQDLKVTDVTLAAIGMCCTNLVDLMFTNLDGVTEKGFKSLVHCPRTSKLKNLVISFCEGLTDCSLIAIGQAFPNLKQVCLQKSAKISDKGLKEFTSIASSLQDLKLEESHAISMLGLIDALGSACRRLKGLTVVKCHGLRDPVVHMVPVRVCQTLKSVSIRSCPEFGNKSLAALGMVCPFVESLELNGQTGITDEGLFGYFGSTRTSLVKLSLAGSVEVTDRAVFVIVNLYGKSLRSLSLERCRKLTDHSINFIANWCSTLQDLDVSNSRLTDIGLLTLASASNQHLQVLSLAGCLHITDKCVPFIIRMGKSLIGLNLQHCSALSMEALDFLGLRLHGCDILR